jgi:hypothetical protein
MTILDRLNNTSQLEVQQQSLQRDADFFRHYMQQSGRP